MNFMGRPCCSGTELEGGWDDECPWHGKRSKVISFPHPPHREWIYTCRDTKSQHFYQFHLFFWPFRRDSTLNYNLVSTFSHNSTQPFQFHFKQFIHNQFNHISRGINLDVHLSEVSYKQSTHKYEPNLKPSQNEWKGSIASQIGLPSHNRALNGMFKERSSLNHSSRTLSSCDKLYFPRRFIF